MFLRYFVSLFLSVLCSWCLNDVGVGGKISCYVLWLMVEVACMSRGGTCCFRPSEQVSPRRE